MAKSKSKRMRSGQRAYFPSANTGVLRGPALSRPLVLSPVEDRRTFHPAQDFRPARVFYSGAAAKTSMRPARPFKSPLHIPGTLKAELPVFSAPSRVMVCVRRQARKEVLHALNRTRSGAGRSRRRNTLSNVSCR